MIKQLAAIGLALSMVSGTQAAVVTYDFTITNPFASQPETLDGVFSYDDTATPSGPPGIVQEYQATSFSFGGEAGSDPLLVIYNNFAGVGNLDLASFVGRFRGNAFNFAFVFPAATFSSTAASEMNGRSFSDLTNGPGPSGPFSSLIATTGGAYFNRLTALSQRTSESPSNVPVPATLALLSLGLVGIVRQRSSRTTGKGAAR